MWGLPGLRDISVAEAVYASCALPGFYPPGGSVDAYASTAACIDNLPVSIAGRGMDAVIAVDTGLERSRAGERHRDGGIRVDLHARGDDDDARAAAGAVLRTGRGRR